MDGNLRMKNEYKVHQLHATWIKPEVVVTKKYTGYLHYRFITTGSRCLWSPCCSYMCFLSSCVALPIVCPSYDIVFPMYWTFLWWVNVSVLAPYYTCYSVNFQRNKAFVGLSNCRTIGPSDYRTLGLSDCRTIGLSDNSYGSVYIYRL
jgi:hypothetical protein